MNLQDQFVLITGAAGRIGSSVASIALQRGAQVLLSDKSIDKLRSIDILSDSKYSSKAHLFEADITSSEGISSLISFASTLGCLTSAVHSAYPFSAGWGTPFENQSLGQINEDLGLQLGSSIILSRELLENFKFNKGGRLVLLSSIQGVSAPKFDHYEGTSMVSPIEYSAIKAGIISITKWLAKYYSGNNITVNCVSPGGIIAAQPQEFVDRYRNSCTNFGMLLPSQVATTVAYLLSNDAAAINGQNIIVDDGWTL